MTEPMQAPYEMTQGLTALKAILEARPAGSSEWSEASNRFHFVDRLLKECLGWQNTYLEVEFPDGDGGRADYMLGSNNKAVLEVKREAVNFGDLPTGKRALVRKMSPLLASSKNLTAAAKQVVGYCSLLGVDLAVVSNGPQMMIFQSSTSGYPPLEGECFFFNGFEEILEKFDVLWRLLSPEGVSENRALKEISQLRIPRMPPKASDFFVEPKKYRYRSVFQEEIQSLSSLLLEDLEDSKDLKPSFYRDCYVADEANSRHLLLSKRF
jgi:predicted type IV restriction endonuclease